MADEAHIMIADQRLVQPIEPVQLEAHMQLATPTPEQIKAADGVFAQRQEGELVQNLIGLWSGALLLHHVAVETFTSDEDEEEEPLKKPRPEEPEPQAT